MTTDEGKDKRVDVGDALTESVRYSAKCNARCSRAARFLFDTGQRTKATRRVNFARFLFLLQFRARALFFSFSVPETRIDTDNGILIREVLQARELRVTRSTRFSTSDGRSSIDRETTLSENATTQPCSPDERSFATNFVSRQASASILRSAETTRRVSPLSLRVNTLTRQPIAARPFFRPSLTLKPSEILSSLSSLVDSLPTSLLSLAMNLCCSILDFKAIRCSIPIR